MAKQTNLSTAPANTSNDFITREEFIKHEAAAKTKFNAIYDKLNSSAESIDNITDEVGEIKVQTGIIGARVDSIMTNIDSMSRNMDTHFELMRENVNTREEKNLLQMEKIAEELIEKERLAHQSEEPSHGAPEKKEEKPPESKGGGVIPLIITGLSGILVAAINILPNILNRP